MSERVALITGASSGLGRGDRAPAGPRAGLRLVLVARRADRLEALAAALPATGDGRSRSTCSTTTRPRAPARTSRSTTAAGSTCWSTTRAPAGAARSPRPATRSVRAAMALNFDAQLRLTEALLPLLRASAPSAIVNIASTAGPGRPPAASAPTPPPRRRSPCGATRCAPRSTRYGVHVGDVMPGFIPTEGFPQRELAEKRTTRWLLGTAGAGGRRDRRGRPRSAAPSATSRASTRVLAALRTVAPGLVRRVLREQARRRPGDDDASRRGVTAGSGASAILPGRRAGDGAAESDRDEGSAVLTSNRWIVPLIAVAIAAIATTGAHAQPTAAASARDRDHDGLPDGWERRHGLSTKRKSAGGDPDRDGLSNRREHKHRTHPRKADTDGDGVKDGREVRRGTNPRKRPGNGGGGGGGGGGSCVPQPAVPRASRRTGARSRRARATSASASPAPSSRTC